MTLTTEEYWTVGGVDMSTYAYNLETLGGRLRPIPLRGDNWKIPFSRGSKWKKKWEDERILTFAGWIHSCDVDGLFAGTEQARRAQWNSNWETVLGAFWDPDALVDVVQRRRLPSGLKTLNAKGEYVSNLEPVFTDRELCKFTVDMRFPDPYFYDLTAGAYGSDAARYAMG
jgi:hypothetical protein